MLTSTEPSLSYTSAEVGSDGPGTVSVAISPSGSDIYLAALSKETGTCFYLHDNAVAGTFYGSALTGSGKWCPATDAADASATSW
jgi:hypothetical protein